MGALSPFASRFGRAVLKARICRKEAIESAEGKAEWNDREKVPLQRENNLMIENM